MDVYLFGLDLVYMHMDLNTKVRFLLFKLSQPLIQRTDSLYGIVLAMAQALRSLL